MIEAKRPDILKPPEVLPRTRDTAWMIGILAFGGQVRLSKGGYVTFSTANTKLLEKFVHIGEGLFGSNYRIKDDNPLQDGTVPKEVTFRASEAGQALGDLSRSKWPQTVQTVHTWINNNPEFIWGFIEGAFEKRGFVREPHSSSPDIRIRKREDEAVMYTIDMLTTVGINGEPLNESGKKWGIGISGKQVKHFANNIHSVIDEKEQALEECRKLPDTYVRAPTISRFEIIKEWVRINLDILQGKISARYSDIKNLRNQGLTHYSPEVYADNIGEGTFGSAKQFLDKVSQLAIKYKQGLRTQISDDDLKFLIEAASTSLSPDDYQKNLEVAYSRGAILYHADRFLSLLKNQRTLLFAQGISGRIVDESISHINAARQALGQSTSVEDTRLKVDGLRELASREETKMVKQLDALREKKMSERKQFEEAFTKIKQGTVLSELFKRRIIYPNEYTTLLSYYNNPDTPPPPPELIQRFQQGLSRLDEF